MTEVDEVLLANDLDKAEQVVRDHTDEVLGTVVLQASTLRVLLHRMHALMDVGVKVRPLLRLLAVFDPSGSVITHLADKLDEVLPAEKKEPRSA